MKKKTLIIVLVIFGIISIVLIGVYLSRQKEASINTMGNNVLENTETQGNEQKANIGQEQNKIVTDDFSVTLPASWSKTINTPAEVIALAANPNEEIADAAAQKIDFKSYLAISSDTLQEKTMDEYMQSVKTELQNTVPGVVFANESNITINERPARAIELEITQQEVDFKVLMVMIQGNGDNVWIMSYNTTKSNWDKYKEAFSNSAKSFILKKP